MRFREERSVARPPDEVWRRLLALDRAPAYVPWLESLEPLDGEPHVGARVLARFHRAGREQRVIATVTAYEPERLLALEAPLPVIGAQATLRYDLVAEPPGTRLGVQVDLAFHSILAELGARALQHGVARRQHEVVDRLLLEIEGDEHAS